MKKRIALFLALLLLFTFTGCDQLEQNQTTEPQSTQSQTPSQTAPLKETESAPTQTPASFATMAEFEAFIGELFNLRMYEEDREDDGLYYQIQVEPQNAISNEITIDGHTLTLPCTYDDIISAGWTPTEELREVWEGSSTWYHTFSNSKGKKLDFQWVNPGEETNDLANILWTEIELELWVENYDTEQWEKNPEAPGFSYMNITAESTLQEVLQTLGEPTGIGFYLYDNSYDQIDVGYAKETEDGRIYFYLIFDAQTGRMMEVAFHTYINRY